MWSKPFGRPRTHLVRIVVSVALAGVLSACSGGGGTQSVPSSPQNPNVQMVQVTFTYNWNGTLSTARTPKYVPATARSIGVSVNGGTSQFLNAPASTLVIDAPVGTDTFAITAFDAQNGQGNVLSRASVTKQIVAGAANSVSATLNGVVTSLSISLSNSSPNAGVPATVNVNLAAKDADGNVIVGPGDYSTTIHLTISDASNSGTLSLSTNDLPNSATTATLTYNGGTLASGLPGAPLAAVVASATGVTTQSANFTPTPTIYQFSIPVAANKPQWIAAGSDGNMWFTESPGNAVARITPAGVVTEFLVPTAASNPQGIVGASDGNLWFTEFAGSKVSRVTTTGTFTEFSTLFATDGPQLLVDRGDGNVWFTGNTGNHVGFQGLTSGVSGETTVPTANSKPFGIATAPDNALYFSEQAVDKIGRISNLFGTITEISLTAGSNPQQMIRGPDGNVWFIEDGDGASRPGQVGRLNPNSFSVTGEFPTVTPNGFLNTTPGITVGQDGALWVTEPGLDRIGRVTTGGVASEYTSSVTGLGMKGIAVAPDGSLWFCESGTGLNPGRIGKLVY